MYPSGRVRLTPPGIAIFDFFANLPCQGQRVGGSTKSSGRTSRIWNHMKPYETIWNHSIIPFNHHKIPLNLHKIPLNHHKKQGPGICARLQSWALVPWVPRRRFTSWDFRRLKGRWKPCFEAIEIVKNMIHMTHMHIICVYIYIYSCMLCIYTHTYLWSI